MKKLLALGVLIQGIFGFQEGWCMRKSCHLESKNGKLENLNDVYEKDAMSLTAIDKNRPPICEQKERLRHLKVALLEAENTYEKLEILDALPEVDAFFSFPSVIKSFLAGLSPECEYVIKATFAIGQGPHLFHLTDGDLTPKLRLLLEDLLAIEAFYADIGGIVGYQHLVLSLLEQGGAHQVGKTLLPPKPLSLLETNPEVNQAILTGIYEQGQMAELYPVGGAADRLQLKDDQTEEALPAARLIFLGKPLLAGVIGDLQAREYLHYKLLHKQVVTPIVMMTSNVHRNDEHIRGICEQNHWFRRPQESFRFVTQPSVPVFTRHGDWCLQKPLKLLLKPGGHGMLWKLLEQGKVFEWFKEKGCKKALIRQINNPMAATDYGLLAFLGFGLKQNKAFGFASCSRLVNAHEGMNVIKVAESGAQSLTNVEYCDFAKFGIEDRPHQKGSKYSLFPSNTNVLFADLEKVSQAVKKYPFPGLLVNFRKGMHFQSQGSKEELARLETTMQNIADVMDANESYLTFNERRKTISTTKRKSSAKGALLETPEGCYYDYMLNARELLEKHCGFTLPKLPQEEIFIEKGPSFLFSFHPALGPLYAIIGQKIQGGVLHEGSELQLEIADLEMKHLDLEGSLLIHAERTMGHLDPEGHLHYSDQTGQCSLKNVRVINQGINWEEDHLFWKHEIKRSAALKIVLHGHSQFLAEEVTIRGDLTLEVPHGMRMTAKEEKGRVIFITEPLESKGPFWNYSVKEDQSINLSR
ncbi:MAG: UTP--glucose-1-phosphate uridylyltransferase [Simkaniaceae bacterium]